MCGAGGEMKLAWHGKHFGEEPPLTGNNQGAGAIFFSHCNLKCVFCQNYQISQQGIGKPCTVDELVQIMLDLQGQGCANVDLVSPTLWWKSIQAAIIKAREQGLTLPIVWNSNGYESIHVLKEMNGLIDIYLPDFKYSDDALAFKYSGVKNYVQTAMSAISEMWHQVGGFTVVDGVAKKGLIVRHLVLPGQVQNSLGVLDRLAPIGTEIHVSLMNQYEPLFNAHQFPEINRRVSREEFEQVHDHLVDLGFENGWVQEFDEGRKLVPDFTKSEPFGV